MAQPLVDTWTGGVTEFGTVAGERVPEEGVALVVTGVTVLKGGVALSTLSAGAVATGREVVPGGVYTLRNAL